MKTATFFITIIIVMAFVYFGYKPPQTIEKIVAKVEERIVEVPKIEEKIVEVPQVVEKIVEVEKVVEVPKVVERIVEVPVEKREVMTDSADSNPSTDQQRIINAPVYAGRSPYAPRPYYQPTERIGGYRGHYVPNGFQHRNFHPGVGGFRRGR